MIAAVTIESMGADPPVPLASFCKPFPPPVFDCFQLKLEMGKPWEWEGGCVGQYTNAASSCDRRQSKTGGGKGPPTGLMETARTKQVDTIFPV